MLRYTENPECFNNEMLNHYSFEFCEYVKDAIKGHYDNNFFDEFPRFILKDVLVEEKEIIFEFENRAPLRLEKCTFSQSNSSPKKFYVKSPNQEIDGKVVIFNC